jgi:hypothetical protein
VELSLNRARSTLPIGVLDAEKMYSFCRFGGEHWQGRATLTKAVEPNDQLWQFSELGISQSAMMAMISVQILAKLPSTNRRIESEISQIHAIQAVNETISIQIDSCVFARLGTPCL